MQATDNIPGVARPPCQDATNDFRDLNAIFILLAAPPHRTLMAALLSFYSAAAEQLKRMPRTQWIGPRSHTTPCQGVSPMLDIVYLAAGGIFLGFCVLYALACDHL